MKLFKMKKVKLFKKVSLRPKKPRWTKILPSGKAHTKDLRKTKKTPLRAK